jgi:CRISPR/Cas system-associated endonuclease Cas1
MSQPLKKQIWREIVSQKITNQANVLRKNNFNPDLKKDSDLKQTTHQVKIQ